MTVTGDTPAPVTLTVPTGQPIIAADPILRGSYGIVAVDADGHYFLRSVRAGDSAPLPGPPAVEAFRTAARNALRAKRAQQ